MKMKVRKKAHRIIKRKVNKYIISPLLDRALHYVYLAVFGVVLTWAIYRFAG